MNWKTVPAVLAVLVLASPAWADYDAGKRAMDAGRVAEALREWRAAAASEDRRAMLELGRLFVRGLGVPQNYVRAHAWLNLAAARGEAAAAQERDALAAKMTPSQIAAAQERADSWRPGTPEKETQARTETAPEAPAGPPPARAIRQAQALLAALGYKPGPADGKWGRRTGSAYAAFLRDAGLPPADALTPAALRAMRRVAARQGAKARPAASPARPAARTLVRAVRDGDIDAMNAALKAGVDVNGRDGRGWTALMHAADKGYRLLVPKLLEAKPDPDVQTADGATALFLAVLRGHEEIAAMLVRAGADTEIKGPRHKTALDVARSRKLEKTAALLEAARADRKAFIKAREADTSAAYGGYIVRGETGILEESIFDKKARRLRDVALDREVFENAEKANTAGAFRTYLSMYPKGKFVEEARKALDDRVFAWANEAETGRAYLAYLSEYPKGRHRAAAEKRVSELDREGIERARKAASAGAYRGYLFENPKGRHHAEARTRLREIGRQTRRVLKRANIRTGPGKEHEKTGLLEPGDEVRITARTGEWLRIEATDKTAAFVHASLVAAGALEPTCADATKGAGCWLEVANLPGCYVWNGYLSDKETVAWSGRCIDGKASGTGKLTSKYREDGKWTTSSSEGEMVDGLHFGRWVNHSAATGYSAEGPYVNGKKHGRWIGRWASGGGLEQEYRNGSDEGQPGVYVLSRGNRYPGKWSGGCFRVRDNRFPVPVMWAGESIVWAGDKTKEQCESEAFCANWPLSRFWKWAKGADVQRCLTAGAGVNAETGGGNTPLHFAAGRGRDEAVQALIAAGADVNARDRNGETPLHEARSADEVKVIETLIAAGADIDARDDDGNTTLHEAVYFGKMKVVEALIAAGADVNVRDNGGETPLHEAVDERLMPAVKALIAARADVNARSEKGWTPLHSAANEYYVEAIKALIAAGADVNARDNDGKTPLHLGVDTNKLDQVKALIAAGADVNARDNKGNTPLYHAWDRVKEVLVAAGAIR